MSMTPRDEIEKTRWAEAEAAYADHFKEVHGIAIDKGWRGAFCLGYVKALSRPAPATEAKCDMTKMTPRKITTAEACDNAARILHEAEAARIEIATPRAGASEGDVWYDTAKREKVLDDLRGIVHSAFIGFNYSDAMCHLGRTTESVVDAIVRGFPGVLSEAAISARPTPPPAEVVEFGGYERERAAFDAWWASKSDGYKRATAKGANLSGVAWDAYYARALLAAERAERGGKGE